jgi:hypothetical protein
VSGQSLFQREGRNPLKSESPNTSSSSDMPISPKVREGEKDGGGGGRRVMGGYRRGGRVEWRVRRVKQISRLRKQHHQES